MQKKIVLGLTLFFLLVSISGCTNLQGITTGQVKGENVAELVSYQIDSWTWMDEKIGDGFKHEESVNCYKIQGKIKNKLDHTANILLELNFYDGNDNYLGSEEIPMRNVPRSNTPSFTKNINKHVMRFSDYWTQIEKVTFTFTEL